MPATRCGDDLLRVQPGRPERTLRDRYRLDAVYVGVPIAARCLRSAIRSGYTETCLGSPVKDRGLHALG